RGPNYLAPCWPLIVSVTTALLHGLTHPGLGLCYIILTGPNLEDGLDSLLELSPADLLDVFNPVQVSLERGDPVLRPVAQGALGLEPAAGPAVGNLRIAPLVVPTLLERLLGCLQLVSHEARHFRGRRGGLSPLGVGKRQAKGNQCSHPGSLSHD